MKSEKEIFRIIKDLKAELWLTECKALEDESVSDNSIYFNTENVIIDNKLWIKTKKISIKIINKSMDKRAKSRNKLLEKIKEWTNLNSVFIEEIKENNEDNEEILLVTTKENVE